MSSQGTTPKPEDPQNLAAKPTQAHLVPSQRVPRLPWEGALGLPWSVACPGPCGCRNTLLTCLGLCTVSCSGHCTSTVPRGPIFIYGAGEDFSIGPLSLSPLPNEQVLRSEAESQVLSEWRKWDHARVKFQNAGIRISALLPCSLPSRLSCLDSLEGSSWYFLVFLDLEGAGVSGKSPMLLPIPSAYPPSPGPSHLPPAQEGSDHLHWLSAAGSSAGQLRPWRTPG